MSTESKNPSLCPLAGRVLLSLIYVVNGFGFIGAFPHVADLMASKGLPLASVLLMATTALWLLAGACLMLGWQARKAALVLLLAMIPVTVVFHTPWAAADAAQFQNELNHFLKNLAILGGLLYIITFGAGAYSLDNRRTVAHAL